MAQSKIWHFMFWKRKGINRHKVKRPKCPSKDKWIKKNVYPDDGKLFDTYFNMDGPWKDYVNMKSVRHKKTSIL